MTHIRKCSANDGFSPVAPGLISLQLSDTFCYPFWVGLPCSCIGTIVPALLFLTNSLHYILHLYLSQVYSNVIFIGDSLYKTILLLFLASFFFSAFITSNILNRTSITGPSIYKVHHCLVALRKALKFKAQLSSTFHGAASYCMFLKIKQKEGPLSQIKM